MTADIRIETSEEHGIEVHVPAIASWDGLDTLATFFVDHFGASILERIDGPDAQVIKVDIKGLQFVLVHDDLLGNKFYAQNKVGEKIARSLAEGLRKALEHGA